ncbi:unnamed protein product [Rotaria sp. Silwood2]|nr:unnamed protein product [Rotaria sp. Silwood2]CAF2820172.1 unnamed protein product [Rotaria sp. Silwood2]CAF3199741.1 unnamed protein product [Rotaria sp. Silwood2]CAF3285151.1 unnamed protein product [Rotaria sp. Silwood2]CAF4291066.1 unnamed protein product [Rotaria sp. Silwood2]
MLLLSITIRQIFKAQQIIWSSATMTMRFLYGFQNDDTNLFQSWISWPSYASAISEATARIHINLRVFHYKTTDRSPSNGNSVEVMIHDYIY